MPRIDIAQFQPTGSAPRTPGISMHALDAEFQAGRSIAQAGNGLVQTVADIDQRIKGARENAQLRMAEVELDAAEDDFNSELGSGKDTDFDTWESRWEKRVDDTLKRITPRKMSSRGKAQWDGMASAFKLQSSTRLAKTRRSKEAGVALSLTNAAIASREENGDEEGAMQAIAEGERDGVFSKEQAAVKRLAVRPNVQTKAAYAVINTDPARAVDMLKAGEFPAVSEHARHTLLNAAEAQFQKVRRDELDAVESEIIKGQYPAQAQLDDLVARRIISKTDAAHYTVDAANKALLADSAQEGLYEKFVTEISNAKMSDIKQQNRFLSMMGKLNGDRRNYAKKLFDDLINPASPINSKVAGEAFQMLKNKMRAGVFGSYRELKMKRNDKTGEMEPVTDDAGSFIYETNPDKYKKAESRYSESYDALIQFLREKKNPTLKEAQDFVTSFDATNTVSAAMMDWFGGSASTGNVTDDSAVEFLGEDPY